MFQTSPSTDLEGCSFHLCFPSSLTSLVRTQLLDDGLVHSALKNKHRTISSQVDLTDDVAYARLGDKNTR